MKKFWKIMILLLALILCFVLGWRVMPKIWPGIKESIVYPIFPALQPTPAPTQEPYSPKSNAQVGDPIAEEDSVIYYFYKCYCPYCREIDPLMGALPDEITLSDGAVSKVKLIAIDKSEDAGLALIQSYYETYNVPEEKQYVPAVVIGDEHLMPGSEIIDRLLNALCSGEGTKTLLIDGAERVAP